VRQKAENRSLVTAMRWISIGLLALHTATLVYVLQQDSEITLGVQVGNVIYSADFPRRALRKEKFIESSQIQAEVKNGEMTIRLTDGRTVSSRVIQVQRVLAHPLPD
jgi:hypothetical protein